MTDTTAVSGTTPTQDERHWLLVGVLSLIYTCAFVDRNVLALLVDPIKSDLAISDTEVSLLLGVAFSLFYAVLNVPAGLLIDRFGRRGIIGGATVSWSIATMICGMATSFWQLFAGRAGVGRRRSSRLRPFRLSATGCRSRSVDAPSVCSRWPPMSAVHWR